jgi:hypothetical protein
MSINGNAGIHNGEFIKRMTADDGTTNYQNAMTPSIMSSHSNKRQSHNVNNYNGMPQ